MAFSGNVDHGLILEIKHVPALGGVGQLEDIVLTVGCRQAKILVPLTGQLPGRNLKAEYIQGNTDSVLFVESGGMLNDR